MTSDHLPLLASALLAAFSAAMTLAVPSADAGGVTLWACHGPTGQPLGVGPLVPSSAGDGIATTYGSGCSGQTAARADGGLVATFGRPDTLGGSFARWGLVAPPGTALTSVTLDRATSGFGGTPLAGDRQSYQLTTPRGIVESASLDDATDVALSGAATLPVAAGGELTFGVACGSPGSPGCPGPSSGTVGVEVSSLALRVTDDGRPQAAVGGVEDPAAGSLRLNLRATDPGLGLSTARATLEGAPPVTVPLGAPGCAPLSASPAGIDLALGAPCPASVTDVPMTIATDGLDDGPHRLTVTVTDIAGNTTTPFDELITVRNHPKIPGSSVLLSIGPGGQPRGPGGVSGGSADQGSGPRTVVCISPQLTATLASRPLGISPRGIAVLWGGTRYLFTGRLTCVTDHRNRVGAPDRTVVDIRSLIGRRAVERTGVAVYHHGIFRVLLHPRSTRIIRFTVGSGKARRSVSIPVIVTPPRGRAATPRPGNH